MEITQDYIDFSNKNSLYNTIGIKIEQAQDGKARSRLVPNPDLCWPFEGQPHGGVLFTILDTTMAWAVISQLENDEDCTTVSLEIQYTHPAKGEAFLCTAWVTHRTGRSSFVRADIHDTSGNLLCMGQGTFRIIKPK